MKKNKLIDRVVYLWSRKPNHYKEVRNPPKTNLEKLLRPQDARQVQYNNWSKKFKVYSGSYLPKDKNKLLKRGWEDQTNTVVKNNKSSNPSKFYRRKSTKQWVRNDVDHWHWYNWWKKNMDSKIIKKQENMYYDEYGNPCKRDTQESHIWGKD